MAHSLQERFATRNCKSLGKVGVESLLIIITSYYPKKGVTLQYTFFYCGDTRMNTIKPAGHCTLRLFSLIIVSPFGMSMNIWSFSHNV